MKINSDEIKAITIEDEPGFYHNGCHNCRDGLGNNLYQTKATFINREGKWDHYDILLCSSCILAYYYSELLEDDCKNAFQI